MGEAEKDEASRLLLSAAAQSLNQTTDEGSEYKALTLSEVLLGEAVLPSARVIDEVRSLKNIQRVEVKGSSAHALRMRSGREVPGLYSDED